MIEAARSRLPGTRVFERYIVGVARLVASREGKGPYYLVVEFTEHEDRTKRFFTPPVLLKADVCAEVDEPEFAFVNVDTRRVCIEGFLVLVPTVKVFLHRCAMGDMIARRQ